MDENNNIPEQQNPVQQNTEQQVEPSVMNTIPTQQPAPEYQQQVYNTTPSTNGKAIASLTLGIGSLLFLFLFPYISPIMSIVGIVFGVIARKETSLVPNSGRGLATAGFVCSIVSLALVVFLIGCAVIIGVSMLSNLAI